MFFQLKNDLMITEYNLIKKIVTIMIDQSVFKDYETYLDALGTGLNDMIITCKTSKDVINVTKETKRFISKFKINVTI